MKLVPPACGASFQQLLLGSWQVQRILQYRQGGYTGQFTGTACVTMVTLQDNEHQQQQQRQSPGTLLYREEGQFVAADGEHTMSAHREYAFCYNTTAAAPWPVQVHFVERADHPVELGSHFIDLSFRDDSAECSFRHHCAPDVYTGTWRFVNADAFRWSWRINGPRKDGEITTYYTRL